MGPHRHMLEQEASKPRNLRVTLGRLLGYFKPFWWMLFIVLGLLIVNSYVQVLSPQLTGQAFDCYVTPALTAGVSDAEAAGGAAAAASQTASASEANCTFAPLPAGSSQMEYLSGLGKLVLLLLGISLLGSLTGGLMFYAMGWTGHHVLRRIQTDVFEHLNELSVDFHTRNESGDLMSRITNDVSTIQQMVSFALVQVLSSIVLIIWIAWVMISSNWVYGLISLSIVPLMAYATVWFSNQARKAFRTTRKEIGNVNAELEESISGVREVQAFSREDANIESFQSANAANRDANIKAVSYTSALAPTLDGLGYVALAITAGVGGYALLRGGTFGGAVISLGLIITFIGYSQRFQQPIAQISIMWTNIQSAIAGAERIFELLDEAPEIVEKPGAIVMPPIAGHVVYKGVTAEYKKGEPVLRGIDLEAKPGDTVAIVGPTGAGKTTLVNLLPRFYDVTGGSVTIDGIDVRDVTFASLRTQIGMVLQDTFLFGDTVMNNIRYGKPEASDEEVIAAAKMSRADEFITRLPEGYQTTLGERGGGLSQGQRQLLSIARAALANPRLLILDEATSSVDTRTERQIQAALEQLMEGKTSFVIAHRLSTIRNANQVLVLVKGEIVERGTHESLLAQKGVYYDLYMSQFKKQDEVEQRSGGLSLAPSAA